jgi:hypothetical protein
MDAAAHNPAFAKKVGIPIKVAKEFSQADKGRKFAGGGDMKESKKMIGKEVSFMKKKGAPKAMIKHEQSEMMGMKKGGKAFAAGGLAAGHKAADGIAKKGKTKGMQVKMMGGGKC